MRWLTLVFIFCLSPLFAQNKGEDSGIIGGLSASNSLQDILRRAEVIVVGAGGTGLASGTTVTFPLPITRVIEGDAALAGSTLTVDWQPAPRRLNSVPGANQYGIWFLRNSPSGWIVVPLVNGLVLTEDLFLPVPAGPILTAYSYTSDASLDDKIAAELASAIESAQGGASNRGLRDLQYVDGFDALKSAFVPLLYQRMTASGVTQEEMMGLAGLIRQGNVEALKSAVALGPEIAKYTWEAAVLGTAIRELFRQADPASVTALGKAAVDPNVSVPFRQACAHALQSIHTQAAVPFLATLLDDPDRDLQSAGVAGLAAFANGLPIQTRGMIPSLGYLQRAPSAAAPWRTPETLANQTMGPQGYQKLPFWKSWWAANRTALGY